MTNRKKLLTAVQIAAVEANLASSDADGVTLGVVLLGAGRMREVNRTFLQHDYVTDVIAFNFADEIAGDDEPTVGEVLVCPAKAVENAADYGTDARREIMLCIVHGILHLSGMDDSTGSEKTAMRREEGRILSILDSRCGFHDLFEVHS